MQRPARVGYTVRYINTSLQTYQSCSNISVGKKKKISATKMFSLCYILI